MDLNTQRLFMGAAAETAPKLYVEDVFSTYLYTGNGSTQTITNGIDLSGEGGLVWLKQRSATQDNLLVDTARGASDSLASNSTSAGNTIGNGIGTNGTFNSNGFTLGNGTAVYGNQSTYTYASWTFRKAEKFFDVVTFTAGTNSNRRISHSLGSTPGCIILKRTDGVSWWHVYHVSTGRNQVGQLQDAGAFISSANVWGTADPTSTDFGFNESFVANGANCVAYVFAHDAGGFGDSGNESVVKCGSYTGNGSATGPFVDLGWEPQWVLVKNATTGADTSYSWYIHDTMRGWTTTEAKWLRPNTSDAEGSQDSITVSATGFRPTYGYNGWNLNGNTYIYIAIRRGPMKTPTDATKVFSTFARSGTGSAATITTPAFPVDFILGQERTAVGLNGGIAVDRMRGAAAYLRTPVANAEGSSTAVVSALDSMTGFSLGASDALNGSSSTYTNWIFRRAPGFFDVVAYTGTGSARTVAHNLGVAPELMIVKDRSGVRNWFAWVSGFGVTDYLELNLNTQKQTGANIWNSTAPTSTVFSVNGVNNTSSNNFIAYLFATCPGVSKVFNFTGTGTTKQIDCGFTNGARFVMIKRTDSTGDWYVWDSARGITSGNDPYLLLNSTAAEVTNTDYIDPYSAGFEISSTAPAAINANGGSYIGLAIA